MTGDALLKFSINQNFASGVSQNVIDLGEGRDRNGEIIAPCIGFSHPIIKVHVSGDNAKGLTGFSCDVEYAADEAFTNPIRLQSFYADISSGVEQGKELISGAISPREFRYLRLKYIVTGTPGAKAKITAGIYTSH